jgi:magnesium chelatase subunit D
MGALCDAALALGIESLRVCCLALRVSRTAAALRGSREVQPEDVAWAGRLVLGPRARTWPAGSDASQAAGDVEDQETDADPGADARDDMNAESDLEAGARMDVDADANARNAGADANASASADVNPDANSDANSDANADGEARTHDAQRTSALRKPSEDAILAAAAATLPRALLATIAASMTQAGQRQPLLRIGRSGQVRRSAAQGRPVGARRGEPRGRARLDLLQTLRAAAPWQALRRREQSANARATAGGRVDAETPAILVRRADFHVRSHRPRTESTTIFAVDASGSQALHRLAEAKGAVELLLAECYVRRDRVAVLAFRGAAADVLLPPTRSLVRAKRCLAALPGGGGTPLASGIDSARVLAEAIARTGGTPLLVLLTDGKANVARDGRPGRAQAQDDAKTAARAWRAAGLAALLLDTAPDPQPQAHDLAREMNARYVALPHADAHALARAVAAHRT